MIDLSKVTDPRLAVPADTFAPYANIHDLACNANRIDGRGKTVQAFLDEVNAEITRLGLTARFPHYDVMGDEDNGDMIIPSGTETFACYSCQDEEGFWSLIHAIYQGPGYQWHSMRIGVSQPCESWEQALRLTVVATKLIANQ
jgi:hypothetical protein